MNLETLLLHPEHPRLAYVVVEQPRDERMRIRYDPASRQFIRTEYESMLYARGFRGLYGWIAGSGTPPAAHHDALVVTSADAAPGQLVEVRICGMFKRADGDNKFIGLAEDIESCGDLDFFALPSYLRQQILSIYPDLYEGEEWLGGQEARNHLLRSQPTHD